MVQDATERLARPCKCSDGGDAQKCHQGRIDKIHIQRRKTHVIILTRLSVRQISPKREVQENIGSNEAVDVRNPLGNRNERQQ